MTWISLLDTCEYLKNSVNNNRHAIRMVGTTNTYTHDANGNMSGGGRSITYNPENMPSSINGTTFAYDHAGQRVKKISSLGSTIYIGNLYECTGGVCTKHILSDHGRLALSNDSGTFFYHPDHLGSANVITDATGWLDRFEMSRR